MCYCGRTPWYRQLNARLSSGWRPSCTESSAATRAASRPASLRRDHSRDLGAFEAVSVGVYDFALLMTFGMGKPLSRCSACCFFQVVQERGIFGQTSRHTQTGGGSSMHSCAHDERARRAAAGGRPERADSKCCGGRALPARGSLGWVPARHPRPKDR